MNSLSLFEFNGLVRKALELTMPDSFWVRAEISELRVASNGHCYLELVEHSANGQLVAKARANIWRNVYAFLRPRFERESGQHLQAGMEVLVQVQVSFHEQYGYSLTILDIDPTYSLGEAARRRKEILDQLTEDGVINMNKELTLPCPICRVAVISSATAAGYGDFCQQIKESGLPFTLQLFPAMMQGDQVEDSVIQALADIAADVQSWDVVAIIRGGGATADLNGFESYMLAAHVAQFPLPVISGIGHERDDTVVDLVAHTRLKTPTAVAAFLINQWNDAISSITLLEQRLNNAVHHRLTAEEASLSDINKSLLQSSYRVLASERAYISSSDARLRNSCFTRLQRDVHKLALAEKCIQMADPQQIIKQGYSLTRLNGKVVRNIAALSPGDIITTTLSDGEITSIVE